MWSPAEPTGLTPSYQPKKLTVQQPERTTTVSGERLFARFCAACHGLTGEGGAGPPLRNESAHKDLTTVIAFIKNPHQPMPKLYPVSLSDKDVRTVAAYVESLH
jgi:mono/diheme cytochrome c family protein